MITMDVVEAAKREVVFVSRLLWIRRLTLGSGGNVSVRVGDLVVITPSKGLGRTLADVREEELCILRLDGTRVAGGAPSIESRMHLAIYRARDDVRAVIHTHTPPLVAIAETDSLWSAFITWIPHELKLDIALVQELPAGSEELARAVSSIARSGALAAVLRRHGVVVWGRSLKEALARLEDLCFCAEAFIMARILRALEKKSCHDG